MPASFEASGLSQAALLATYGETRKALQMIGESPSEAAQELEQRNFEVRLLNELERYDEADSLLALSAPMADERETFLHCLKRARLNFLAGRYEKVLQHLAAVDSAPCHSFGAYRNLLLVRTYHQLGDLEAAKHIGEACLAETGGVEAVPAAIRSDFEVALVDVYEAMGRTDESRELLTKIVPRTRGRSERFELVKRLYDLEVASGNLDRARNTALRIAREFSRQKLAEEVTANVLSWSTPGELTNEELCAHAGLLIDRSHLSKARVLLKVLESRKLGEGQKETLQILKARYSYGAGRYQEAADLAKPRFRNAYHKRLSMLILARSYRRMGDPQRAAALYECFAEVFPNDGKAAEALHVAVGLHEAAGNRDEAMRVLERLRTTYPSNYFGRTAVYRTAKYLAQDGDYRASRRVLELALERSRRTDEAAMFYLAITCSTTGDNATNELLINELRTFDPFSFYLEPRLAPGFFRPHTDAAGSIVMEGTHGLLDFLTTASELRRRAYARLRGAFPALVSGEHAVEATACIERGAWFLEVGFLDWGEKELERARMLCGKNPLRLLELARIYDSYGMPWQSVRLYQKVKDSLAWQQRKEYADEFRRLLYPIPYPVLVLENAARYDLPPHLVYAMIREESRFDWSAVSRVGALGLMQLMPETGRYVARELEMPDWGDEALLEPEINLAFGIWYASSLMEESDHDPLRMLAAYNAGPKNAKRWFSEQKSDDSVVDLVDGIDFKETRSYVQRIVESANIYHHLYFCSDVFGPGSDR